MGIENFEDLGMCWYILWSFGTLHGHLVVTAIGYIYVMVNCYILWSLGIFLPVLKCCMYQEKIWQPCSCVETCGMSRQKKLLTLIYILITRTYFTYVESYKTVLFETKLG
jgi:hypothetical protein